MRGERRGWGVLIGGAVFGLFLIAGWGSGQQILQNGFEARGPYWKAGGSDASYQLVDHKLTEETAHAGQRSEHIRVKVEKGSFIHFTFDVPRAPITEELNLALWLKSNRPGVQLLCRVVLPRELDPKNGGQPLTTLVRADPYKSTRWKLVGLREPVKRLQEQQQLLNNQMGRPVVTAGAYIDQLILNVCDGPGMIDVWIDELEIGPVEETKKILATPAMPTPRVASTDSASSRRASEVQVRGNQLLVGGKKFFLRGIRHTGSPPLRTLRDAGFNTIWLDETASPTVLEESANLGFHVVASLTAPELADPGRGGVPGSLTSREGLQQKVSRFLEHESVLAWDLGSNLGADRFNEIARLARTFRLQDPNRPVMADVWDGFKGYSRSTDQMMIGTHRWPLMTSLELSEYREWLDMRRRLATDGFCWTWIQTHLPDWYLRLREADPDSAKASEPMGPQPEQIRLLAYSAIAAGFRGLAFWSDRFLSDTHQGKERLLAMALLNQELAMLEPLLVNASRSPDWVPTSRKEVMAAVFRLPEGVLVLPIWIGKGSQYVAGQSASSDLSITVPGVPITATAWEVSPGRIQSYPIRRDLGGNTIKLRNFSLNSAVIFTSDLGPNGVIVRLQDQQRRVGRLAAQWLQDQAREELAKVEKVVAELEKNGHQLSDTPGLLERARKALDKCMQHRRNGEHSDAYAQAELALRSLRLLMRSHWDKGVKDLDSPVSSPYAVSFFSLPQHFRLLDQLKQMRPAVSVLPGGDFEIPAQADQAGWLVPDVPPLDEVDFTVRRVSDAPHGGQQCLMMKVQAKDPQREPAVLERTYVALQSPTVKLPPGTLVRISAWVRIPQPIRGSVDGALMFDSVGGEPLGIRLVQEQDKWKKYSVFRKVPESGKVQVTLALSGLGTIFFDDVRVEPLVQAAPPSTSPQPAGTPAASPQPATTEKPPTTARGKIR